MVIISIKNNMSKQVKSVTLNGLNHEFVNIFDKILEFSIFVPKDDVRFISIKQVMYFFKSCIGIFGQR